MKIFGYNVGAIQKDGSRGDILADSPRGWVLQIVSLAKQSVLLALAGFIVLVAVSFYGDLGITLGIMVALIAAWGVHKLIIEKKASDLNALVSKTASDVAFDADNDEDYEADVFEDTVFIAITSKYEAYMNASLIWLFEHLIITCLVILVLFENWQALIGIVPFVLWSYTAFRMMPRSTEASFQDFTISLGGALKKMLSLDTIKAFR